MKNRPISLDLFSVLCSRMMSVWIMKENTVIFLFRVTDVRRGGRRRRFVSEALPQHLRENDMRTADGKGIER